MDTETEAMMHDANLRARAMREAETSPIVMALQDRSEANMSWRELEVDEAHAYRGLVRTEFKSQGNSGARE